MHKVRLARIQAGLSQDELAEKANVSQHTISEVELGRRRPQGKTLRKLAAALDVSIPDLIGEVEQDPKAVAPSSLAEFLEERCGHAYLARNTEAIEDLINSADPLMVDRIMDQLRQEITALGEERKKYPAVGRWRWEESFIDLTQKYLLAGFAATERSPERHEAALRMAAELERPPTQNSETA